MNHEGLANAASANPSRVLRLHPRLVRGSAALVRPTVGASPVIDHPSKHGPVDTSEFAMANAAL